MPRAGGPPGGRGVGDAATGGDRGGGVWWGRVGGGWGVEYRERVQYGPMEGCNKGKNEMEKRKKNGKKTTTQDAQSHRKCMQRTTQKPGRGRGERLDCEPEGQTPPSPSVSHSPCIPCPVPRMGSEGAGKPMCLPPTLSFLGSQSTTRREMHAEIKVSYRCGATGVKGKLREGSKA